MIELTDSGAWLVEPYRYLLWRKWNSGPILSIGMLNPSTADATKPDPTLHRCVHFAKLWGFGGLIVFNPFALRSPSPKVLLAAVDLIGPQNDQAISYALVTGSATLVAWGAAHKELRGRISVVEQRILLSGKPVYCLGRTQEGLPKHPLARGTHRVPDDQQPIVWRAA